VRDRYNDNEQIHTASGSSMDIHLTKECRIGPRYLPTWFSAQEG
jgi:hypothetical protein